jgi:hypothetical protein
LRLEGVLRRGSARGVLFSAELGLGVVAYEDSRSMLTCVSKRMIGMLGETYALGGERLGGGNLAAELALGGSCGVGVDRHGGGL